MEKTEWKPFLKHPYTKLRDLGFGPHIQSMPKDQADELLSHITVAAIQSGNPDAQVDPNTLEVYVKKERKRRAAGG